MKLKVCKDTPTKIPIEEENEPTQPKATPATETKITVEEEKAPQKPKEKLIAYEQFHEERHQGYVRRFLSITRQLLGLLLGAGYSYLQEMKKQGKGWKLKVIFVRLILLITWPFLNRDLIKQPFPIQFRRRLEMLGPSFIKLGQILSLRDDILPKEITNELKNLLKQAPIMPFDRAKELIENDLKHPINELFLCINPIPLGSGSLAQTHRAKLISGEEAVIKILKPGVRQMVERDVSLLKFFGNILQIFLSRYKPAQMAREFGRYSLQEVDLRIEADNAEIFAANFKEDPKICFPKIYRKFSNRDVLCMEYFRGSIIDAVEINEFSLIKKSKLIDLAMKAIIQMVFRDGFFHADLHPANIIVMEDGRIGFIDLGMVGQLDNNLRIRLFYYFYSLIEGKSDAAARYLTALSTALIGSDPAGFRRAVEDLNRRWLRHPKFNEFSLGQLVLESLKFAGRYRIEYPDEIILIIKAMITLEGVGNQLIPAINVIAVSKKHIRNLLLREFNPIKVVKDSILLLPELIDTLKQSPLYINEFRRLLEFQVQTDRPHPFVDILGTIFGGICLIVGAILAAFGLPWWLWAWFFLVGFSVAGVDLIRRRKY
ncbi:MAG: AarF/UbiB family protein [Methanotrichaceae archaeon]|nr:AarF/UbiB family protein [Methanotrichaceae archaeon]